MSYELKGYKEVLIFEITIFSLVIEFAHSSTESFTKHYTEQFTAYTTNSH